MLQPNPYCLRSACAAVGFDKVVKEAHQKAKAAAKAEAAANAAAKTAAAANGTTPAANKAVGSSSKAAASTGKKAASAKKGTASAKRAPKAAQTAAETSPPDAAEMAIELGKALAQAASGAAAIPGTESKEAQQQAAAVSREQRYQARQAATAPQAQPAQGQGQGPDQGQGKGQNGQPRNGQSSDLHSLGSQGTDRATPPWESLPAGQQGAKRRKLSPGLMQSLTNGSNGSSADAQVSLIYMRHRYYLQCHSFVRNARHP